MDERGHQAWDAHDRLRLRKSLLQLGGLLLLVLLTTTLLGLFASWSLERAHLGSERALIDLLEAVNLGRDAQVNAKRQVQEWKDLLLRGQDAGERTKHQTASEAAASRVQARLEALTARLEALALDALAGEAKAAQATHAAVSQRYRDALHDATASWDPFALDRAVRGVDRPLNDHLDLLVDALREAAKARFEADQQRLHERYEALTKALWTAMVVALLLVGVLLWRVLRARHPT